MIIIIMILIVQEKDVVASLRVYTNRKNWTL